MKIEAQDAKYIWNTGMGLIKHKISTFSNVTWNTEFENKNKNKNY